jgi:glutathione S-transferase
MSLTFYYAPMSTAVLTKGVLEELGIPVETKRVDLKAGDTHTSEFLMLNPNGRIPVIVHDGVPIWESAAITMYLGETFGVEKKLWPGPGTLRGVAMKWITWTHVTFGDAVGRWLRNTADWTPSDQHNAKAAEAAMGDLKNCLKLLDDALTGAEWLVGSFGFSLVDTHVNSFVDWGRYMKLDFAPYPHLNAWSARCAARPAYKRTNAAE